MTKGSLGAAGYAFPTLVGIDGADLNQLLAGRRRGGILHDESAGTLDCPAVPAPGHDLRFNYRYLSTVPQCQELCSGSRYAESHSDTFPDLVKLPRVVRDQWAARRASGRGGRPDCPGAGPFAARCWPTFGPRGARTCSP